MNDKYSENIRYFLSVLREYPTAVSEVKGSPKYPYINGRVSFYQTELGVLVFSQFFGLPTSDEVCKKRFFAFHIHSGDSCTGNGEDAFADAGQHYNPDNCPHPEHAGDLLPLLENGGWAFELFLTDGFTVSEIIGRTVIVHICYDDFTSQPSGNAGEKIACGVIEAF